MSPNIIVFEMFVQMGQKCSIVGRGLFPYHSQTLLGKFGHKKTLFAFEKRRENAEKS